MQNKSYENTESGRIYDGPLLKKSGKKVGNDLNHVESFMAKRLNNSSEVDAMSRSYRTAHSQAFPSTTSQDAHN